MNDQLIDDLLVSIDDTCEGVEYIEDEAISLNDYMEGLDRNLI